MLKTVHAPAMVSTGGPYLLGGCSLSRGPCVKYCYTFWTTLNRQRPSRLLPPRSFGESRRIDTHTRERRKKISTVLRQAEVSQFAHLPPGRRPSHVCPGCEPCNSSVGNLGRPFSIQFNQAIFFCVARTYTINHAQKPCINAGRPAEQHNSFEKDL